MIHQHSQDAHSKHASLTCRDVKGDVGTQPPWDVHLLSFVPLFMSRLKRYLARKRPRREPDWRADPRPPNDLFENGHGSRTRFPSLAIVWSPWTSLGAAQPLKQLQTETSRHPYVAGQRGSRVRAVDNAEICPTWSGHGINSESAEKNQVRSILSQFPLMSSDWFLTKKSDIESRAISDEEEKKSRGAARDLARDRASRLFEASTSTDPMRPSANHAICVNLDDFNGSKGPAPPPAPKPL